MLTRLEKKKEQDGFCNSAEFGRLFMVEYKNISIIDIVFSINKVKKIRLFMNRILKCV